MTEESKEKQNDTAFNLKLTLIGNETMDVMVNMQTSINEISQVVYDSPKNEFHTCFHLALNGKKVSPYVALGEIEGFTPEMTLVVVPGTFFTNGRRLHGP